MFKKTLDAIVNHVRASIAEWNNWIPITERDTEWLTNAIYTAAMQRARWDYYAYTGRDLMRWNPDFKALIRNTVSKEIQKYL